MTKPRVLFVSRGRIELPLERWLAPKWDALESVFEVRALNPGTGGSDPRFRLLSEQSWRYYPSLALHVAAELRRYPANVVVASDPYVGAAALAGRCLARSNAKVIVELHGDPATFARLYGSEARRLVARVSDRVALAALRSADATRAVSSFTARLVQEARGAPPTATFLAYSDLSAFTGTPRTPIPRDETVVFVGALEPYKNVDGLAAAWREVVAGMPDARLTIVGRGSQFAVVEDLVRAFPQSVTHHPVLPPHEVAGEIDKARVLVLPSYPEGLGRVVLEAFARGRPVIGTDGGGIPDMVAHDQNGLLFPPYDVAALAAALQRVLEDRGLVERLGDGARTTYEQWHQTPADFADAYVDLVQRVLAGAR
ncbi:MAG: glycosyltransferase family 4 protein [Actinobacteria bacterium]|nr:glycosyltransferase family 4 protein [Actinomycetota bacterium]